MRLLSVICNPGMVNRHWLQIADLFGDQEFVIDTASSLSVMIDMKLNDKVLIWGFLGGSKNGFQFEIFFIIYIRPSS